MGTAESSIAPNLVGAVLSRRLRLTKKLGEGGMGEVYAAEPVAGGSRVAVKLLRPEFLADPNVLSRFLEEGRTSMRLVHPNIARTLECSPTDDTPPYMVMELLEGVPLGAYTINGGRVPLAQAVPILQGILAGLAAAHAHGIIHRDLKPDNVFLARESDGTFVVKLLDFGVAKVMDAAGGMGNRTRTGMLLGTPAYMSPEQVKSSRDVDPRTDLWSAGVMFYEMLSGRVAFPAPTEFARLTAVLTVEPEPIDRVDPALALLAPFMARAMSKDRDQRFASAIEMARALVAAVPSAAAPVGSGGRVVTGALSRLPEVPSLFAPSAAAASPATGAAGFAPPVRTLSESAGAQEAARGLQRSAGGTLASQPGSPQVSEQPPQVVVVASPTVGETLPSKDLPMLSRGVVRGVAPTALVALVAMALVAGFLLGWALARMQ